MSTAILYIHGQGGNPEEARHYQPLFEGCDVIGLPYRAQTPWEARLEFPELFDTLCCQHESVTIIANSIGAYFAMGALADKRIDGALFISPIVDMERLILGMMAQAHVSEDELCKQGIIEVPFGQTLSWEYLSYVRTHPISWHTPTHILYGSHDALTSRETIVSFAQRVGATLSIMDDGEHWFHTPEQMRFLDQWVESHT